MLCIQTVLPTLLALTSDILLICLIGRDSYLMCSTLFSSSVPVGNTGMPQDHILHNIRHAISVAMRKIPRGWKNIQSIHVKTTSSMALPLFNSLPTEPKLLGQVRHKTWKDSVDITVDETEEGARELSSMPVQ